MDQGSARLRWTIDAPLDGPPEVSEGDDEGAAHGARRPRRRLGRAPEREGLLARRLDSAARRVLDIVVAATVLVLALPALVVIALAIVIESPGPVFYRAERVGRWGGRLRMLKFRKMWPDAKGKALTAQADLRLTRVGAILAKTRLDELPQLFHILRGQMSLVGPRPEDPGFVAENAAAYREILTVRPGLTGFAQLAYADERRILSVTDPIADYLGRIFPAKCRLDLLYIREQSLMTNLRVIAWTSIVLITGRQVAVNRASGALGVRRRLVPGEAQRRIRARRGLPPTLEPAPAMAPGSSVTERLDAVEDVRRRRVFPRWGAGTLTRPFRGRGTTRRARERNRIAERSREELESPTDVHGAASRTMESAHTEVSHEGRGVGRGSGDAFAPVHDRDPEAVDSGR